MRKPPHIIRSSATGSHRTGNILGIAVFALGLAAISGMGLWAYTLLQKSSVVMTGDISETASPSSPESVQDPALLGEATKGAIPSESAFQGLWEAGFHGGENALIAFDEGRYQILITDNPALPQRLYAQGTYYYDEKTGVLDLQPRFSDPPPAPAGLIYEPLTRRAYKIQALLNKGTDHLFLKPYVAGGAHDQVHPLFSTPDLKNSLQAGAAAKPCPHRP
ncbi:MAG: hypothetical protein LRY54_01295 [Alphaproteobacteria bacterium]|nr:hypothetical protein [Alphaproteobacteria bacterium]